MFKLKLTKKENKMKLRSGDNEKMNKSFCLKIDSNLNTGIRNHNNIKIIVPKELKLKKNPESNR
jgi:hypothetical protein